MGNKAQSCCTFYYLTGANVASDLSRHPLKEWGDRGCFFAELGLVRLGWVREICGAIAQTVL